MELRKNRTVEASMMGTDGNLSVLGVFQTIQDAITELMGLHKIDGKTVKREYDAFWVFVKTRVKFVQKLGWQENFVVSAFFSHISVAKMNIDVQITTADGELAAYSKTEACALDRTTQRIRKLSTVGVERSMLAAKEAIEMEFTKFEETELPLVGTARIQSTNVDFSYHTNNTEYVRLVMNAYTVAELDAMPIREMEIIYAGQSYENDVLGVKKAKLENRHLILLEKDGVPVVRCEIII